jgi:hypothetical protein
MEYTQRRLGESTVHGQAPLTLSMDSQNTTATDSVWHIITNTHGPGPPVGG